MSMLGAQRRWARSRFSLFASTAARHQRAKHRRPNSNLRLVGPEHAKGWLVVERQTYPLTRSQRIQGGAFHVPGDGPGRFVVVDDESQTELGQHLLDGCQDGSLVRLHC